MVQEKTDRNQYLRCRLMRDKMVQINGTPGESARTSVKEAPARNGISAGDGILPQIN